MSARPTEVEFDPSATLAALVSSQRVAICSGLSSRVLVNSESGQQVQFDHLKRRKFIELIGGTALLAPFAIRAQQPAPASGPLVGFLNSALMNPTNPNVDVERVDAEAGARKLGLETVTLNARNAREIDTAFEQLLGATTGSSPPPIRFRWIGARKSSRSPTGTSCRS